MQHPFTDSEMALTAVQATKNAADILRKGFGSKFEIQSKGWQDLVTEFDKASEQAIIQHIKSVYPDHSFLAEESGASQDKSDSPVLWVIDPLDGTMNYAHNIPIFAISIAATIKNEVHLGVIYQPMTNELFIALKGRGAYLNGKKIWVSDNALIQHAVGATGFPYDLNETRLFAAHQFNHFLQTGNPIRILGSAAINLAYIAAGRFDVYWAFNLSPWDIAAGKLIIEEAGGTVTHYNGMTHTVFKDKSVVASNTHLHMELLSILNGAS